jgi:hypothetical protein
MEGMGFRDSRLRGKIDAFKHALSRIRPEEQDTEYAHKIREQLAETEAELERLLGSE